MFLKGLVFLVGLGLVSAGCKDYSSCGTCAGQYDDLLKLFECEWCDNTQQCDTLGNGCKSPHNIGNQFNCPRTMPSGFEYTDDFARNKVLPFIAATNGEQDSEISTCLSNRIPGATLYKSYSVKCDGKVGNDDATCFAYIAVSPNDKAVIVAFRGTQGALQLVSEGGDILFDETLDFSPIGGKVDKYFVDAYNALWDGGDLKSGVQTMRLKYPTYDIWIVGHSLGGSLASMLAPTVVFNGWYKPEKVKTVTFGEPRTGDINFAKIHDAYLNYTYRIVHNKDSVPHLPEQIENLFDPPFHHRFEVWYQNDMSTGSTFQVCTHADDSTCSGSLGFTDLTANDHNNYFNVDLPNWVKSGCQ